MTKSDKAKMTEIMANIRHKTLESLDPPRDLFFDDETRFWYRDEDGKAHRVEMEYLLPSNSMLVEETYLEQDTWGNQIDRQTHVTLPYFPGDIYYNHKAVPSRRLGGRGELTYVMSAGRNGASLEWLSSEKISEYASEQSLEFNYEEKSYLVKYVVHGSHTPVTKDGRRGRGGG